MSNDLAGVSLGLSFAARDNERKSSELLLFSYDSCPCFTLALELSIDRKEHE